MPTVALSVSHTPEAWFLFLPFLYIFPSEYIKATVKVYNQEIKPHITHDCGHLCKTKNILAENMSPETMGLVCYFVGELRMSFHPRAGE